MRIDKFWIGKYKNLNDVCIDFDEHNWITVVLGWNGTGKSNVLEALATLFRDLIMDEKTPSFRYKINYVINDNYITIDADPLRKESYQIYIKPINEEDENKSLGLMCNDNREGLGDKIGFSKFKKEKEKYLPKYIFGYYSGHSLRMEEVFKKYLAKYDRKLRNGEDPGLRQMFYALPVHSQFVLLAFLLQQDDVVREFLDGQLGIDPENGIDSVLFVLKEPIWNKNNDYDRFWHAKGVVRDFLDRLYNISLAPIRVKRRDEVTLWNKKTLEYVYLYVKDLASLRELVGDQAPREFFRDLESTYVSELIEEVRIRVKLRKNDGSVIFKELSEGEQQLLTVLGLLRFTAEEESLFLLDEPDTHLNPTWSIKYLEYLQKFVGGQGVDQEKSHILLTTHNPMAIAELQKEQIQILSRDNDSLDISASMPDFDPIGMGFAGILTSDMFGLTSSLDLKTTEALYEKNILLAMKQKQELTKDELLKLDELTEKLQGMGFRRTFRDPMYSAFLQKLYEKSFTTYTVFNDLPKDEKDALISEILVELEKED